MLKRPTFKIIGMLFCVGALASCNTQITSLRQAALKSTGAGVSGVPPEMTSLTVMEASPTRNSPITLQWGLLVGSATEYCILENVANPAMCIWRTGAPLTSYSDSAADGPLALTAYFKNAYGISSAVTSNTVTIDRTAPMLASVSITTASPTNSATIALSYGAVTASTYSEYCITTNNTSNSGCAWVSGTLPASYALTGSDGAKTVSVWVRDDAGNESPRVQAGPIVLDTAAPTVAFTVPTAGATVNAANAVSFAVSGTCSEIGRNVVLSGAASATVPCSGGMWSTSVDLSGAADGPLTLRADHSDAAGNAAAQATVNIVKDATPPTVAITSPAAGSTINAASAASFAVSGTCSENGRNVVISGSASATVACSGGSWSANLNFSAAADGAVSITANHSDAAGNTATPDTRAFTKDATPATVAITLPAAGSTINAASAASFAVSGTCSENGQNVVISGSASATVACSGGTWSTNLDFSAAADGAVSITANHSDAAGNAATPDTRAFTKNSALPSVAITSPAIASVVALANSSAFATGGTCSASGQPVNLSTSVGTLTSSAACSAGSWSANLDFNSEMSSGPTPKYGNLVGYWKLNGTVGAVANGASVPATIGVNATAANANGTGMAYVASRMNQGLSLDGVDDYVSIPNTHGYTFGTNPFSVSLWFNKNVGTNTARGDLLYWGDGGCPFGIFVHYDNTLQVTWPGTGDIGGPIVTLGAWHHVVATREAGNVVKTYLDGLLVSTGSNSFDMNNTCFTTNGMSVGANQGGLEFPGKIDEVAIWNTSLTASDVLALYSGQKVPEGAFNLLADHSDASANAAPQASRGFVKDTIGPDSPSVVVNGGAAYTNSTSVTLTLSASGSPTEMYVTYDDVCGSGGTWEAYATTKAWTLLNTNMQNDVRVKFRDAAGNESACVNGTIIHDGIAPTVAFSLPAANSYVTTANMAAFTVSGTCSENGRTVSLSGPATASVTCAAHAWSKSFDLSALGEGTFTFYADTTDAAGNNAVQASRAFIKDTLAPTVAITSPAAGAFVTTANMGSFLIQGSCSEAGQNVVLSGAVSANAACSGVTWSYTADFSGAGEGNLTVTADLSDAAGNAATQDSRTFVKDTVAPTVTITGPAVNTWAHGNLFNTASRYYRTFTVSGNCSENGRNVSLSAAGGAATGTATCTSGAWSADLDLVSVSDGTYTTTADLADAAGNVAPQDSRAFQKDTVAPTITVTSPNGGETWYTGVAQTITYTVSDALSGPASTLRIDNSTDSGTNSTVIDFTASNTGTYSWTPPVGAASANARINVMPMDIAGNNNYDWSNADFTIAVPSAPSIPASLAATPSYGSIALTWSASTGSPTPTYDVLRSTTSGSGYAAIATGLSVTNYTDPNATHGTVFYYVVRASNVGGTSANSSEVASTSVMNPSFAMDFRLKTVQPQIGTQSFTFARNDSAPVATHFGPDGLLRFAPHNYLQRSEQLDVAPWAYSGGTIGFVNSDPAPMPSPYSDGDSFKEGTSTGVHVVYQSVTKPAVSQLLTFSTFVKEVTRRYTQIAIGDGTLANMAYARFDARTGTAISQGSMGTGFTPVSMAIEAAGSGWYRVQLTATTDTGTTVSVGMGPMLDSTTPSYTGTNLRIVFWGAQLEMNRTASNYLYSTTASRFDGPRFDYDPVTHQNLGLRMDENATNLATNSEAFDNASWTKSNASISANTGVTTDPMGGNGADSLVEDTSNALHAVRFISTKAASSANYAGSIFVKAGSRSVINFEVSSWAGGVFSNFNLATGTVGSNGTWGSGWTLGTPVIDSVGNGWYRVRLSGTSDTTTDLLLSVFLHNGTTTSYTGNGTGNVYVWGAQLEMADPSGNTATTGTNYIPTGSSAVSRANEFLTSTGGLGSWYQSTGTWYADWRMSKVAEGGPNSSTLLRLSTADSTATADYRLATKPGYYVFTDRYNASRANFSYYRNWVEGGILGTADFKAGFTINSGDTVARMNGGVSTSVTTNDNLSVSPTRISIGQNGATNAFEPFSGWVREIRFYRARISDADLASMTSTATPPGFSDDFEDPSMLAKWVMGYASSYCHWCNLGANPVTSTETSGQLRLSPGTSGIGYDGYVTADTYDFTGSYAEVHVVEPGRRYDGDSNNHGCGVSTTLSLFPGSSTTLSVDIDQYLLNGSFLDVLAELENPTTNWSVLYNTSGGAYTSAPTTYTYVRIRHDLPTDRLVTEYSNDRWTWTTLASTPRFGSLSAVRIGLITGAGCQDTDVSDSNPAFFDDFRTNAVKN
ncbi:MAG: LamG domain-containing protein [Bdellovibrionales bacterium]|nr:LamG domain-containing protein [Bdellovibrionales bacterium]